MSSGAVQDITLLIKYIDRGHAMLSVGCTKSGLFSLAGLSVYVCAIECFHSLTSERCWSPRAGVASATAEPLRSQNERSRYVDRMASHAIRPTGRRPPETMNG